MPRKPGKVPAYCLHKPSGQARVILDGKHVYLGQYGSAESHERYGRLIAESHGGKSPRPRLETDACVDLTVSQLILTYWKFAETYYSKDGEPTKELACVRDALRPLRSLYGSAKVEGFGPKSLRAVRQHMIEQGLTRRLINYRIGRIKRVFKWGVAEELVPPSVFHGLQALTGLRYGRTDAREAEPIRPVEDESVDATVPYLSPPVAAMVEIQRLTGMRPGEVVLMRPADIEQDGDIWVYEPHEHKNTWRGHKRRIPLGPQAQRVLRPFLERNASTYLFSPTEAEQWRQSQRRNARKTPLTPSQRKRRPKAKPKRAKGGRYTVSSYRRAITYAVHMANKAENGQPQVPNWCPLQIRHSLATEVRRKYGLDAAQVALGHARADVTEVYAERNLELASKIAREMG